MGFYLRKRPLVKGVSFFFISFFNINSIMKAFENSASTRKSIGGNGSISNKENLDPTTPTHSADPIERTVRIIIIIIIKH